MSLRNSLKNLAEGPEFSNWILALAVLLLWQRLCSTRWHNVLLDNLALGGTSAVYLSAKEFCFKRLKTTSASHRRELRPGQNSMCKVRLQKYKTELTIDINIYEYPEINNWWSWYKWWFHWECLAACTCPQFVPTAGKRERQENISNTPSACGTNTRYKWFNKNMDQATQLSRET